MFREIPIWFRLATLFTTQFSEGLVKYVQSYGRFLEWYYNSDFLFLFFFFRTKILGVIWALCPNETGKGSLSKVVQPVLNYLQLNFQKDWSSTPGVMANFWDGIIIIIWTYYLNLFSDPFPDPFPRLLHVTDVTGCYN